MAAGLVGECGNRNASLLAIRAPERVKKLVLSNTYSELPTLASEWILSISNFIFSLLPMNVILSLMMKVYGKDEYTKRIIRDNMTIDKKFLIALKTAPFPTHTHLLQKITAPVFVLSGAGKVSGVDEGKAARIVFDHVNSGALALFKDAFDPLTTMRRDIFNELVLDFLQGNPLKEYEGVTITERMNK